MAYTLGTEKRLASRSNEPDLTDAERDELARMPRWIDAKWIARDLCIAESTVIAWRNRDYLPAPCQFGPGARKMLRWDAAEYLIWRRRFVRED